MTPPKHDTDAHLKRTRARLARLGVDVRDDTMRGRCLVAAKAFKRGDLVLANAPYGLPVPFCGGPDGTCAGCFRQKNDEMFFNGLCVDERCKECDCVWFCSERCKETAMAGGHKQECVVMKRYFEDNPHIDPDAPAAPDGGFARISALYRQCGMQYHDNDEPTDVDITSPYLVPTAGDKADATARWPAIGFNWRDFLAGDWGSPETIAGLRNVAAAINPTLMPVSVSDEEVEQEIVRSRLNDFFIQQFTGGDPSPIAAAVYPLGALLNHSCYPTCVCSYRLDDSSSSGMTWIQEFRACRDVKAGEELTHAYVDASDWATHRRAALFDRFGFVCTCARCPTTAEGDPEEPPEPMKYVLPPRQPPTMEMMGNMTEDKRSAQMGRYIQCQEEFWAVAAMRDDKRSIAVVKIAGNLIQAAEQAEEVSDERRKAEKAADLLRALTVDPNAHLNMKLREPYKPCPTVPMRIKALAMASNMAMFEGDFEASLKLGEELVECFKTGYGTNWHAKIANELIRLGGVAREGLGDEEKAKELFREALEIGRVTMGEECWVCKTAKGFLSE